MTTLILGSFPYISAVRSIPVRNTTSPNVSFSATETKESYIVKATIPGINPNDLEIELANQTLTISGEGFKRSFRFSLPLNADAVETSYEFGILTITLPKSDALKPRRITVQNVLPVSAPAIEEQTNVEPNVVEQPAA
jgi:HSP20 family molecular chaperone IbpA